MVKYQSRLELINPIVKPLAELLMEFYTDDGWPEVMLPVPLHRKRLLERGYDQALLLTKALRNQLKFVNLDIEDRLIKRQTNSAPQQSLDARDRKKNIRNAFTLRKQPEWEHVALIDDVVTTGATVNEITKLLKQCGVKRVDIWSIARTPEN